MTEGQRRTLHQYSNGGAAARRMREVDALAAADVLAGVEAGALEDDDAGAAAVYGLIDVFPNTWWLIAGTVVTVFVVLLTNLAPVLLMPLFYRFDPLPEGPIRDRLLGLCDRVGVRTVRASVWKLSEKSTRSNAAVVVCGNTRRVIVSDTMLNTYEPEEIEAVLAHELGHHVSGAVSYTHLTLPTTPYV